MPTIRIDDEVWAWLKSHAQPLEDTPNTVLRRIAGLDEATVRMVHQTTSRSPADTATRGQKIPQAAYRAPILKILKRHRGEATRTQVLAELERAMADQMSEHDRSDIRSGTVRWQKSAEWEVSTMRKEGLLEAQLASPRGVWCLTPKGAALAEDG